MSEQQKIKLPEQWIKKLQKWPEDGMGYQTVDIILDSGETLEKLSVLNSEDVLTKETFEPEKISKITRSKEKST